MVSIAHVVTFHLKNRLGRKNYLLSALILCLTVGLANCAKDEASIYLERPVEDIYNNAMDLLLDKDYQMAALTFEEVERQHPYSMWATKAQLMSSYAHY